MIDPLGYEAKRQILRGYAERYPRPYFIETGIFAKSCAALELQDHFDRLYVIDLHEHWCEAVRTAKIDARCGDSAALLPGLLAELDAPALFWLDAHFNTQDELDAHGGGPACPLLGELDTILAWEHSRDSVLLVDDVRQMGSMLDRPALPQVLRRLEWPWWHVEISDDIIRATPR